MGNVGNINILEHRTPDHDVLEIFPRRWSPRAMASKGVSDVDLQRLFEAARWAPSSYNEQPWRFIYAKRDTPQWDTLFDLLVEGNRAWAHSAGALILLISKKTFSKTGDPNSVHVFDAGAAWQNLALQGASMGLVVHGMAGFDTDRAPEAVGIPDGWSVCAMIAVGHPGEIDDLPDQLQGPDKSPTGRKPISEIAMEGKFKD
jgi:nitroreductase